MNFLAMLLFIGTFTGRGAEGISVAEFDPATGTLTAPALVAREENPTFLAWHPTRPILYAVNEIGSGAGGFIGAFSIEADGRLRRLARVPSGGKSPTHLDVDPTGRMLVVANYGGPGVASFYLDADGLPRPVSNVAHAGSGVNRDRQDGPHPHAASFAPDGRTVFAPDLGADRVFLHGADPATGTLEGTGILISEPPGSGPRHLAFRPDGNAVFVLHELSNAVEVLRRGADDRWTTAQTVSTLPDGFAGKSTAAEVVPHPSGRFLFASNRGADTIAAFRVNPDDATLEAVGQTPIRGRSPRHFTLDPTGRWLLVAGQDSNTISIFEVNAGTGALTPARRPGEHPRRRPACCSGRGERGECRSITPHGRRVGADRAVPRGSRKVIPSGS